MSELGGAPVYITCWYCLELPLTELPQVKLAQIWSVHDMVLRAARI